MISREAGGTRQEKLSGAQAEPASPCPQLLARAGSMAQPPQEPKAKGFNVAPHLGSHQRP